MQMTYEDFEDIISSRAAPERLERMKPVLDRIPQEWGKWLPDVGWDDMLLELDQRLAQIDPGYIICQAKEKFGGLRFYTYHSDDFDGDGDRFREFVEVTEALSYRVCEYCGAPGELRQGGWMKTLCNYHATGKGKAKQ